VQEINGDTIKGNYNSPGSVITSIHEEDMAAVKTSDIEDWMITDSRRKQGGYTIMVLMNKAIAQTNHIDPESTDQVEAAKTQLSAHWSQIMPLHATKPMGRMTSMDIKTMALVDLIERLNRGNTGHEASVEELAKICGLPDNVIEAIRRAKGRH